MSTATTERMSRNDVPQEETWDLSDLFISRRDWEKELTAVQNDIDTVTQYKGKLGQDAKTLLAAAQAFEAYQKRLIRVATYANLRVSAHGSDPENQADAAKVASAYTNITDKQVYRQSEL